MEWERIVYQNWVVASACNGGNGDKDDSELGTGSRPVRPSVHVKLTATETADDVALTHLREQVGAAVAQLSDDEREFIERFYYAGDSYFEIARGLHLSPRRLETIHRRALKRLKKILGPIAQNYYGITKDAKYGCPICQSEHRDAIDCLIGNRDRSRSWQPVMREIRQQFGVRIKSPMTLIGHEKYH